MQDKNQDNPGVIAPPPAIYAGAFVLSLLLNGIWRLPLFPRRRPWLGLAVLGIAVLIARPAFRTMRQAGTNINPAQPATAIVTEGPYRWTRNPIYLGLTLFYTGCTILTNTLWGAVLLPPLLWVMRRGVIEREETYLEQKFGDQYVNYKTQSTRWI